MKKRVYFVNYGPDKNHRIKVACFDLRREAEEFIGNFTGHNNRSYKLSSQDLDEFSSGPIEERIIREV